MMERVVFVDRMDPADSERVAAIWTEHDATGLPAQLGIVRRSLYCFRGLYLHLVDGHEADTSVAMRIHEKRTDPLYTDVRDKLSSYLRPYSDDCTGLLDTMALPFYSATFPDGWER